MLASAPVTGGRWRVRIPTQPLGLGPVALDVRASFADRSVVRSAPVRMELSPPEFRVNPPSAEGEDKLHEGVPGDKSTREQTGSVRLAGNLGKFTNAHHLTMAGEFTIQEAGFYEFVVQANGDVSLSLDGESLESIGRAERKQPVFIPLGLARGKHHLGVEYTPGANKPYLRITMEGDQLTMIPKVRIRDASRTR